MKRPVILVIDNNQEERQKLNTVLGDKYEVFIEPVDAHIQTFRDICPSIILLEESKEGFPTLKKIKEDDVLGDVPVVIILDEISPGGGVDGLRAGASELILRPLADDVVKLRVDRMVEMENLKKGLEIEQEKKEDQINQFSKQSFMTIAHTIDAKDRFSKGQSVRVALCCQEIAYRLGWGEKDVSDLYNIALIHDIGNVAVEDAILNKTTPLTTEEYDTVKQHTVLGEQIVKNTHLIPGVEEGIRYHHERYDGNGYDGLRGDKIPEVARIIAVADAYIAMASRRPYREPLAKEEIVQELLRGRGSQFDPAIVDVLLGMIAEGVEIDVTMAKESVSADEKGIGEMGALLRHVFTESVQESQSELEKDSLTGFLTRQYFEGKIHNYLKGKNARGTFFMMDLDNFKNINDTYGHAVGDTLILEFVDIIKKNVREHDYVCRIGGDEFAIFFPEMDKEHVIRQRAENIMRLFALKRDELGYNECSVSIGIMTKYAGSQDMTFQTMYDYADKALYFAKNNGKDDYHIYSSLSESMDFDGQAEANMNLNQLLHQIEERKYRSGAYAVEYDRFAYIYQFIARNIERSRQQVQIILVTLKTGNTGAVTPETIEDSMMLLETSIIRSLRRGDVTTRFSPTQQIIILMDVNEDNGIMVAERIMQKYNDLSNGNRIPARYDISGVPALMPEEQC